jgi:hypothetical protein
MTKKFVFGVAIVALVFVVMAPAASASCGVDKAASTYASGLAYWHSPVGDSGVLRGQSWQLGAPAVWNSSGGLNCNDIDQGGGSPGFLYHIAGTDKIGLNLHMGTCGQGCPAPNNANTVVVLATNKGATGTDFLVATINETQTNINYDFSTLGDLTTIPLPRPKVLSSSRAGSNVNLSIGIDSIAGAFHGPNAAQAVTGYNVLSASSATDPGRSAAAYTLRGTIAAPGGAAATVPVVVDCGNLANDQWVTTQIVFEGGVVLSDSVGGATRIKCNPALADPKYKIVPKKGMGSSPVQH